MSVSLQIKKIKIFCNDIYNRKEFLTFIKKLYNHNIQLGDFKHEHYLFILSCS